jgi:hypothetical protein
MIALSSTALRFIAALASNDTIKESIQRLLGDDSLASKYVCANFATGLALVVVLSLHSCG